MNLQRRTRQAGVSMFGLLFVVVVLACVGIVAAQVFPTFTEYQAILKTVNKVKDGSSVVDIRSNFDKAAIVDDIKSISGKDLVITKFGDKNVVSFAYDKEVELVNPVFLLIKFEGRSN